MILYKQSGELLWIKKLLYITYFCVILVDTLVDNIISLR
uniref:Uncharacterized protein n=1 Tax=Siphoviridae sp. cttaA39 TaxID=2827960 RepID=A0A8S5TMS6_9CAUD|nr:MAG TPA: hypothetical protein [Siphoviridae sp. cttaA39]